MLLRESLAPYHMPFKNPLKPNLPFPTFSINRSTISLLSSTLRTIFPSAIQQGISRAGNIHSKNPKKIKKKKIQTSYFFRHGTLFATKKKKFIAQNVSDSPQHPKSLFVETQAVQLIARVLNHFESLLLRLDPSTIPLPCLFQSPFGFDQAVLALRAELELGCDFVADFLDSWVHPGG